MPAIHSFYAVLVMLVWGVHFSTIRFAVVEIPPLLLSSLRFIVLAAIVLPFVPRLKRGELGALFRLSVVFGMGHFGLLFVGLRDVDAGPASIIMQSGVLFSTLLAMVFFRERPGLRGFLGIAVGFSGVVIIFYEEGWNVLARGFAILLLASFFWALGNILVKRLGHVNKFTIIGWMSLFCGPQLLALSLFWEEGQLAALQGASLGAWLSLGYTVVISSLFAYALWYFLIELHPIHRVVPYGLLVPVFGVLGGYLIHGDALTTERLLGGLCVVCGVAIVVFRGSGPPAEADSPGNGRR